MTLSARIVLVMLLAFCQTAAAITNIERISRSAKKEGLEVAIDLAMQFNRGNTEYTRYAGNIRLMDFTPQRQRIAIVDHEYARDGDEKSSDNTFVHLRHVWLTENPLDYEVFVQYQQDAFTSLRHRSLAGGGVKWQLLEDSVSQSFHLGAGAYYTKEYYRSDLASEENRHWRGNIYATYQWYALENLSWVNTVYIQPKFDNASDVYALNDSRLESFVSRRLSLFINIVHTFRNKPFADNDRLDVTYRTGLMLRF